VARSVSLEQRCGHRTRDGGLCTNSIKYPCLRCGTARCTNHINSRTECLSATECKPDERESPDSSRRSKIFRILTEFSDEFLR
jgi:hypothetical protein